MEITYQIGDHVKLNFGCQAGAKSWIIKDFYGAETVYLESPRSGRVICTKTSSIIPDFNNANFKAAPFIELKDEEKEYYEEDKIAFVEAWLYHNGYSMVKTDTGYDIFPIPAEDYPDDDPRHKHLTKDEIKKRLNDTFGVASIDKTINSEDITALCQNLELLRRDISSLRYTLQDMTNLGESIRGMDNSISYLNATLLDSLDFAKECEKKDRESRDISEKSEEACKDDPAFVPRFKIGEHVYQGRGKTRYEILDMKIFNDDFEYLIGGKAHSNHWVAEDKLHY